ncbi:MAG: Amuc_1099 family pilus-like system protein [Verrucomicrobiota bacterium]
MAVNQTRDEKPLMRYYDKVVVVVALVILLISLFWLITAGVNQKEQVVSYMRDEVGSLKSAKADLAAINMESYDTAVKSVTSPFKMKEEDDTKSGFLIPERRIRCANSICKKPIPFEAEQCWSCGEKQPQAKELSADVDTNGDGVPDKWLRDWGLPPDTDVSQSLHDDGFSVLEEYKFKTNPRDKNAHPPYVEKLVLKELKSMRLPLVFRGVNIMPGGGKQMTFNWSGKLPRTYWVKENEPIGDTGYVAGEVTVKMEKRENPMTPGRLKVVDVSTVVLKRKSDGKEIVLQVDEVGKNTDVEATLDFLIDKLEFKLIENQEFKLRDETYRVITIETATNTIKVENTANGKQKVVRKLD